MGIKDFLFGLAETALEVLPGGKAVKTAAKGLARATGMAKDLFAGGGIDLGDLAANFGEFKEGTNKELGNLKEGLQGMGNRVSGLEKGLKGMGDRVGNLEGEIKGLGDRTGALEQGMGTLKEGLDSVRSDLEGVKSDIQAQGYELKQAMGEMKSELQDQIERQSELFDHKLQQQDIKFTREISRIDSEIANLHGEMRQQKEELKAEIQQKNEETKQQLRSEMNQQREQLEKAISQITQAQSQVNQAIQEHLNELDERMDQVEKKTIENARKIFTEQLERERKDQELADAIKTTNTKLNDLAQKKQDLDDNFKKHQQKFEQQAAQTQQNLDQLTDNLSQLQGQLNQKTAQTQQDFESLEQEYIRQTRALNAKIADHQDRLEDYAEEQFNLKFAQRKLDVEFRTILDETETQAHLLSEQATKLEFVARGMEEISEETHERINHLHHEIFDLNEQTEEALFTAQKAVHKIDNLTDELANERQRIKELEAQIELNQLETQQAKEEARWANERLDNLIKTDFTEQELAFAKLQKTLQLKADEAKLLAQLNLLKHHSQSTLEEEPAERKWKVGVKTGTVSSDYPENEGFALAPDSWWERRYTGDQIKPDNPHRLFTPQWFDWEEINQLKPEQTKFEPWGQRIQAEHDSALLTTPDKRKPQAAPISGEQDQPQPTELTEELLEQIEDAKSKLLAQLKEIQEQINENLETVENQERQQPTASQNQARANLAQLKA